MPSRLRQSDQFAEDPITGRKKLIARKQYTAHDSGRARMRRVQQMIKNGQMPVTTAGPAFRIHKV